MRASDIMTRTVATVSPESSLKAVIATMMRQRVSGLPVVDAQDHLVGLVTEGDLLRRMETGTEPRPRAPWLEFLLGPNRAAAEYVRTHSQRVEDLMTREVITVAPAVTLEAIVDLMERRRVKRVPVVDDGRLVGVVSRADIVRALGDALPADDTPPPSDIDIRERIEAELSRARWAASTNVQVTVTDGVVTLDGVIFNEGVRPALLVAARNTPGVRLVEDRLVWVEPVTGTAL